MKRVLGALVGSALVAVMVPAPVAAAPAQGNGEPLAYMLVDADSGAILERKNAHEPLPVASAVKLMTALTALQRIPLEDRVSTAAIAADAPEPTLGMREGTTWASEDLVQAMLLSSANDAAYTLAEGSAGSLDAFIAEMERVGKMIGLEDSTFADPAGIDDSSAYRAGSVMSAYDLAIVGVNVLASTELADIVKLPDYRVITPDGEETDPRETVNDFVLFYPDATGLMPGFTAKAGAVLVASARRDGRELVAVVLNAENPIFSAAALLDRGFDSKKNAEGTGNFLPEARITTLQGRLVALAGLPRPLGSPAIPPTGAKGPNAPVSEGPPPKPPRQTLDDEGGGAGFPYLLVLAMFLGAGLVIAAVLRGRNVQRERLHRRTRERYLAEARRRGTIDVLDPEIAADDVDVRIVRR